MYILEAKLEGHFGNIYQGPNKGRCRIKGPTYFWTFYWLINGSLLVLMSLFKHNIDSQSVLNRNIIVLPKKKIRKIFNCFNPLLLLTLSVKQKGREKTFAWPKKIESKRRIVLQYHRKLSATWKQTNASPAPCHSSLSSPAFL